MLVFTLLAAVTYGLIELGLFRSIPFSGATLIAVCAFAALGGFLFLNTLYLQEVRGLSALHAGLYTLPLAVTTIIASPLSGRLVAARGTRVPLTVAGAAMALGMLPMTWAGADTAPWQLFAGYLVFGFGFGMVNTPITDTAVSGLPRERAGVAAAIASTSRQVGTALGVAVIGAVVASSAAGGVDQTTQHAAWWILCGLGVAVLGLGLFSTGRRARATARPAHTEMVAR
ncbi:MFS transporter [Actinoplanes aureus]|uniref:MFS transporter n=1 Tax=Actinoplanes aureus TaxID=2792083 RepID=UPI001E64C7CC|nr:MFS transporter [Actinoplanes aureus]